jgi:ribonucleoside-diphosphate reductase alpha chain
LSSEEQKLLTKYIQEMKFIPGGRYLYYAGRPLHYFQNCFLLRAEEDTREEWASLAQRTTSCLMSGGGIGVDYSHIRPSGRALKRTGGIASGPIPLMKIINEIGRNVMQGGSRRSAIYASLNWQHEDVGTFLHAKDWSETIRDLKQKDFNFPADLDMTNISINWDDDLLALVEAGNTPTLWLEACKRMLKTGEPGASFNFGVNSNETLRNACCEITSEDSDDCCNLGSVNLANIESIEEFHAIVGLGAKFLVCGTLRGDLPYEKVYKVREKNRRIGLGIMGVHEWLLARGANYSATPELHEWLSVYRDESEIAANELCDRFYLNHPVKYRAVAPTGTIGIMASTTTGIEPLFAVAYKRRYLVGGTRWKYEYVIDATAERIIKDLAVDPDSIETAYSLALNFEKRIKFQADVQAYVDHAISSTINLPAWNTPANNEDLVKPFAETLLKYVPRLRGITTYPDGARGGQPLTMVTYGEAAKNKGTVFDEVAEKCSGGICGL